MHAFYMQFADETTLEANYRYKYTVARDEGIVTRSSAVAGIATPLLILAAALYHLLQ